MIAGLDIVFLRPLWLLVLPVIGGLVWILVRRGSALGGWSQTVDPELLRAMRALGRVPARSAPVPALLAATAAALIALALSGPAVERRDAPAFRNLDGAVLVMDLSTSVSEHPRWPDTIAAARALLQSLGAKPAGLVVYAGDAYDAAAITADTRALGLTVAALEAGTVPDPGSRPHLALARALTMIAEAQVLAGDVVLVSDGGGVAAEAMALAARIRATGGRLSVIRAPSTHAPGPDALTRLVETGGGWSADLAGAADLGARISGGLDRRLGTMDQALLARADVGRYLLLLAMIPALMLFGRGVE